MRANPAIQQQRRRDHQQQQQQQQLHQQRAPEGNFVRCPRCSVVLSPPPGAERFRCVCNIVLSAPGAARWTCNICERSSPASIMACVSCGNSRSDRPNSQQRPMTTSDEGGEEALNARAKAFCLRRANQLASSKKRWERRRDPATGQMRWYNGTLIEVEGASAAAGSKKEAKETDGNNSQKGEKKASTSLSSASTERAFVRQIASDGVLSWVPASEASFSSTSNVEGTKIDSHDLEGAAGLPFDQKITWFQKSIASMRVPRSEGVVKIQVRRTHLLEDTFAVFSSMKSSDFRRSLFFEFAGEKGLDYGGVARELFQLLFDQLFNVDFALFKISSGNISYDINENSTLAIGQEQSLEYFHFAGQVFAKALFDGHICQHHLSLPLYKHLLAWPCSLTDLEYVDEMLANSLRMVMEGTKEDVECMDLTFETMTSAFGKTETIALKGDGEDVVTYANRDEYCHLLIKYYLLDRVSNQLGQLLKGFYDVLPQALVSIFDFQELELLSCGLTQIDLNDWRRHTIYKHDYQTLGENHPVIRWFWECVNELDDEEKCRLLQFVTGSSRVPVSGFAGLQGNDGNVRLFTIDSVSVKMSIFPRSHTCFNRLDLPNFSEVGSADDIGKDKLRDALMKVLHMELGSLGFGLE